MSQISLKLIFKKIPQIVHSLYSHTLYPCRLKKYSQPKSWELCFTQWEFLGKHLSDVFLRGLFQGGEEGRVRLCCCCSVTKLCMTL